MKSIITTNRFDKDVKRMVKRSKDMSKLKEIIYRLTSGLKLDDSHKLHKLTGNFKGRWECHIEPDWLLIWFTPDKSTIILERTGTHADLFD